MSVKAKYRVREVADIVETLRHAEGRQQKASLLIGAGCSVSAGIPLASGFVKEIQESFPRAYDRACKACKGPGEGPNYPEAMRELTSNERADLVREYIASAKLNWGHIAIAQLITEGYVDRILSVNFDPLVMRACALLNRFPAIYDFALPRHFDSANLPKQAVFYLHGQDTSFRLIQTQEESEENRENLVPVIREALNGRPLIVVGYSGESDPVFQALEQQATFGYGLFWVGFEETPKPHLNDLLARDNISFVPNQDSDIFFTEICQDLRIFPPEAIGWPVKHLRKVFEGIAEYKTEATNPSWDVLEATKAQLDTLIEQDVSNLGEELTRLLLADELEKAEELIKDFGQDVPDELRDLAAWVYIEQGNALAVSAGPKEGEERERLFKEAFKKYEQALSIKPDIAPFSRSGS